MKIVKLFLIGIIIFLSTGCLLGSAGKGYLTKVCTLTEDLDDITKYEEISITHKDNNLTEIIIKTKYSELSNKYVLKSLKDSIASLQNSLKSEAGVKIEVIVDNEKELEMQTSLDYSKLSSYVRGIYNVQDQYNLQIKDLKDKGYRCK